MARKLSLTIDASDAHEHALAWLLKKDKADREPHGLKPYDDAESLLTDTLMSALDSYVSQQQAEQGTRICDALFTASAEDCAKVADILKCEWP